jgi:hypothetical protein
VKVPCEHCVSTAQRFPVLSLSNASLDRKKLYENRNRIGQTKKTNTRAGGGKGSSNIAGAVLDRPSDNNPTGGEVDRDILDSVRSMQRPANPEDIARLNRMFGLSSEDGDGE